MSTTVDDRTFKLGCPLSTDAPGFTLRLLHAVRIDGRLVCAGLVAAVDAETAGALIRSEAAVLTDDRDLPELVRALGLRNGSRPGPALH